MPANTVVLAADTSQQYLWTGTELEPVGDPATSACLTDDGAGGVAVVPPSWLDAQMVASTNVACNLPNGTIEVEGTATAASQYFTWGGDVLPLTYGDAVAYNAEGYPAATQLPAGYAADHTLGTLPPNTVVRAANTPSQYLWAGGVLQPVGDPATSQCLLDDGASGVAVVPPSWLDAQTVNPTSVTCNLPNGTIEVEGSGTAASQYFTWGGDVLPLTYGDAVAYNAEGYPAATQLPAGYAADHTQGLPAKTVVRAADASQQYLWTGAELEPVGNTTVSQCLLDDGATGVAVVPPSWLDAQTTATSGVGCTMVATTGLPGATAKVAYKTTLTASGGTSPYRWVLASGSAPLPAGVTLKTTGVISGTPTLAGTYTFTVKVTDSSNPKLTADRQLSIVVALKVTPATLSNATLEKAYAKTLSAVGGNAPYKWALVSGSLPAGLSLSSSGVISGKPTVAGTSSFTVEVTDSSNPPHSGSRDYSLEVST
jgi:hypothetical protein